MGRTSPDIDIALDNMLGREFAERVNAHLKEHVRRRGRRGAKGVGWVWVGGGAGRGARARGLALSHHPSPTHPHPAPPGRGDTPRGCHHVQPRAKQAPGDGAHEDQGAVGGPGQPAQVGGGGGGVGWGGVGGRRGGAAPPRRVTPSPHLTTHSARPPARPPTHPLCAGGSEEYAQHSRIPTMTVGGLVGDGGWVGGWVGG